MKSNGMILSLIIGLVGLLLTTSCGNGIHVYEASAQPLIQPVTEPTRLPGFSIETRSHEQARGSYATRGSLVSADALDLQTSSLVKIFVARNRGYGTLDLVTLLENASRRLLDFYPTSERLQVGDTSNQNGGQAGGHASHQNGLDADLVYFRKDKREMSPNSSVGAVTGFDEKFVIANRITQNFDIARNWKWISILASTGRVQRIFVDPVIKTTLCQYAKDQGVLEFSTEVLRMLRPWPLHDDHMHVRLTCPKGSPNCVVQAPPPAGSGCEESMAEVLAKEAQLVSGFWDLPVDRPHPLRHVFPMLKDLESKSDRNYDFAPALQRSLESKAEEEGC